MKRTTIIMVLNFIFLLTISTMIRAEDKTIKPEIALIYEDGWTFSLTPEFVLYENGFVIFGHRGDGYFYTILSKNEKDAFFNSLNIKKLTKLKDDYELQACSDCPTYHLLLMDQKPIKKISAYGMFNYERIPAHGPTDLINALKTISSFKPNHVIEWIPENIEVKVFGSSNINRPMGWPRTWSALESSEWIKGKYGVYTKSFDRNEIKYIKTIQKQQNILLKLFKDGVWSLDYRFPFPKEKIWISEIHKYYTKYYNDEINILADKMEADAKKKNMPTPTNKFFYYKKATKELKKELGLKYKTE